MNVDLSDEDKSTTVVNKIQLAQQRLLGEQKNEESGMTKIS